MTCKQVAIIGGAGFVGSRLSKILLDNKIGYSLFDINTGDNNDQVSYLDIEDIKDDTDFSEYCCLINLAAIHRDDIRPISRYDDVNVTGAVNLCNAARSNDINKIIFTSSVAIYGFAPENTDESGEPNYFNDYGRTKYLAEKVYEDWYLEDPDNRTLVIVRPTVIFGEGNRGNVFNLLNQISSGRFIMFGDGHNKKSMAYVENVASFLKYSLSFDKGMHVYNYIDKPDFTMNMLVSQVRKVLFGKDNVGIRLPKILGIIIGYIADIVSRITGIKLPVSSIRVKKFLGTTQFSSSVSNTGFIAPISLEEGMKRTLEYEFIQDNSKKKTYETE